MGIRHSYNAWAQQYDTNKNKTRDMEGVALRETLAPFNVSSCLEIGCGTGKNSVWFAGKATSLTSVDFSEEMLKHAKEKVTAMNVQFVQADITDEWNFTGREYYDLVTFSLVLEHISNLDYILKKHPAH